MGREHKRWATWGSQPINGRPHWRCKSVGPDGPRRPRKPELGWRESWRPKECRESPSWSRSWGGQRSPASAAHGTRSPGRSSPSLPPTSDQICNVRMPSIRTPSTPTMSVEPSSATPPSGCSSTCRTHVQQKPHPTQFLPSQLGRVHSSSS